MANDRRKTKSEALVENGVVAGNVYDKYQTNNPVSRYFVQGFLRALDRKVRLAAPNTVTEVGCGEGHLAVRLAERGLEVRASDLSASMIERAGALARSKDVEVQWKVADIYELDPIENRADLVVCCEVLEHLPDPEDALAILKRMASPHLLVSVPREPIWRALNVLRGAYIGRLGNTPGHVQHWSRTEFLRFIGREFEIVDEASPFPWTMALCRTQR